MKVSVGAMEVAVKRHILFRTKLSYAIGGAARTVSSDVAVQKALDDACSNAVGVMQVVRWFAGAMQIHADMVAPLDE